MSVDQASSNTEAAGRERNEDDAGAKRTQRESMIYTNLTFDVGDHITIGHEGDLAGSVDDSLGAATSDDDGGGIKLNVEYEEHDIADQPSWHVGSSDKMASRATSTDDKEESLYNNLFPSFNFINFPSGKRSTDVENGLMTSNGSDVDSVDDAASDPQWSLDSSVLEQMADELFDDEMNVRQSLVNVATNKNFYSNYYDDIVKSKRPTEDDASADESDFQKYIHEFNKECQIERRLKSVLDRKRVTRLNDRISVLWDDGDIADNFYVPTEAELSKWRTELERPSPRMPFLTKRSFASFHTIKHKDSGRFLKRLSVTPNKDAMSSALLRKRGINNASNPFNHTVFASAASLNKLASTASNRKKNTDKPPEPKSPGDSDHRNGRLQKKLTQRHLQMIALSGTLGVGLYLSASKNFLISGPFGALLGFILSGSVVLLTMLSLCEMITFIPLVGGVSGIGSRFVDDAFGFAAGFIYWINYTVSLPSEITAGTIMLSYYDNIQLPGSGAAGWITFFLIWVVTVNLLDVRVYGELEFFFSVLKMLVVILSVVLNLVINTGRMPPLYTYYGFKFWDSSQSDEAHGLTYGFFRPTFDLSDIGTGATRGIGGNTGRFLSLLISTCIANYAYVGTEIVVIVAGEARHPRRALPSATNRIFWRILLFYILAIFCVSLNFYSGDPRLLRYRTVGSSVANSTAITDSVINIFGGDACSAQKNKSRLSNYKGLYNGNQSPWIIALQNARQCSLSAVFNGIFVVFALSAGSSQLYASSRTLYQLSLQDKAPAVFSRCSKQGVPYVAVLFSGAFGALAYLCINNDSNNVFQRLMTICSTCGQIVWACMCLAFVRYYYGLKSRTDLISRNTLAFPYKAPLQPYLAYYGLIFGSFLILATGITVFLDGCWSIEFFITSYGSLILFFLSYFIYKFVKGTKVLRTDQIQLDIGRKENDKVIWEETKAYTTNMKEKVLKVVGIFFG